MDNITFAGQNYAYRQIDLHLYVSNGAMNKKDGVFISCIHCGCEIQFKRKKSESYLLDFYNLAP